jgi:hypothetical protein
MMLNKYSTCSPAFASLPGYDQKWQVSHFWSKVLKSRCEFSAHFSSLELICWNNGTVRWGKSGFALFLASMKWRTLIYHILPILSDYNFWNHIPGVDSHSFWLAPHQKFLRYQPIATVEAKGVSAYVSSGQHAVQH